MYGRDVFYGNEAGAEAVPGCPSVVKVLIAAYLVTMVILLVLAGLLYKLELFQNSGGGRAASLRPMCCPVFLGGFLMGKLPENAEIYVGDDHRPAVLCRMLFGVSFCMKQSSAQVTGDVFTSLVLCVASGMLGGMVA